MIWSEATEQGKDDNANKSKNNNISDGDIISKENSMYTLLTASTIASVFFLSSAASLCCSILRNCFK